MASHGFFQYIRLKLIATLMRLVLRLRANPYLKHDEAQLKPGERQLIQIPSRDAGRTIRAWLYGTAAPSPGKKTPVLVNWHGSGFLLPQFGTDAAWCSRVARDAGIAVVDADYRKAPETPFPGALHDAEDVLRWVAGQSDRFDAARVAVSGFSSGACLGLVASSYLRTASESLASAGLQISAVVSFYGGADLVSPTESKVPLATPRKPFPPRVLSFFYDCYLPPGIDRADPRISPALADLDSFPSTAVLITCDEDPLAPEALELAKKLDDGKRKVVAETLKSAEHGFDKYALPGTPYWELREYSYELALRHLKEALGV